MRRTVDIIAIIMLAAAAVANAAYTVRIRQQAAAALKPAVQPPADTVRYARLVFAGDLMAHMPMLTAARHYAEGCDADFDFRPMFRHVAERFRRADYAVVNLETTISHGRYSGYPMFRSPAAVAEAMRYMGVDAAVTANNHCCDGGSAGITTTLEVLDSLGISHTGTFSDSMDYSRNNPHRFKCGGISFALFAYTYGTNGLPVPKGRMVNLIDTTAMGRDFAALDRDSTDVGIVFIHWGNEYERQENNRQRMLADFIRRHGIDIIIGSHPHVVQPFEADSTHVTVYSLGNFISNQQKRYCDGGLIATIDVEKRPECRPAYKAMLEPAWVMCPGYKIIPPEIGDTIQMTAEQRRRYVQFVDDTHRTLYGN